MRLMWAVVWPTLIAVYDSANLKTETAGGDIL